MAAGFRSTLYFWLGGLFGLNTGTPPSTSSTLSVQLTADQTVLTPGQSTVLRWKIFGLQFMPEDTITLSPAGGGGSNQQISFPPPIFGEAYKVSPVVTTTYLIIVRRGSDGATA